MKNDSHKYIRREVRLGFSTSQWISIAILALLAIRPITAKLKQ